MSGGGGYTGITDQYLDGLGGDYLKHYAPIGARDISTLELLQSKGIDSYLSGCMTLTLNLPDDQQREDSIILVDLEKLQEDSVRKSYPQENIESITHHVNEKEYIKLSMEERFLRVEELLKRYQRAKCVITSRLHCALPCLALGTPVVLVYKPEYEDRMYSFLELLHVATPENFDDYIVEYNVSNPPKNDDAYLMIRNKLEKCCEEFIQNAEKGIYKSGFVRPLEEIHMWQRDVLDHAEFSYRTTIKELSKWCQELDKWCKDLVIAKEDAERCRVENSPTSVLLTELIKRIKQRIGF